MEIKISEGKIKAQKVKIGQIREPVIINQPYGNIRLDDKYVIVWLGEPGNDELLIIRKDRLKLLLKKEGKENVES